MSEILGPLLELERRHRLLEERLAANADSGEAYARLLREHGRLSRIVEPLREALAARRRADEAAALVDDPELAALAHEERAGEEATYARLMAEIEDRLVLADAMADRPAVLEIRAGTGGEEAALFAGDLLRMYTLLAQRRGWRAELWSSSPSEQGGLKEAVLQVRGEGAYGLLRFEAGGHRVQRVPATESQGRIHTSAATVAVMPEAEAIDLVINTDDLEIERKRAGGAGGQHVNKTESAIRITHRPTGTVVQCQDEKSQAANLDRAMTILRSRLLEAERQRSADARARERREQVGSGDRSDRVRTYNFPQNRLTDHRVGFTSYDLDRVMDGHLDAVQRALLDDAKARFLATWDGSL